MFSTLSSIQRERFDDHSVSLAERHGTTTILSNATSTFGAGFPPASSTPLHHRFFHLRERRQPDHGCYSVNGTCVQSATTSMTIAQTYGTAQTATFGSAPRPAPPTTAHHRYLHHQHRRFLHLQCHHIGHINCGWRRHRHLKSDGSRHSPRFVCRRRLAAIGDLFIRSFVILDDIRRILADQNNSSAPLAPIIARSKHRTHTVRPR